MTAPIANPTLLCSYLQWIGVAFLVVGCGSSLEPPTLESAALPEDDAIQPDKRLKNRVTDIRADNDAVWFATTHGASRYQPETGRWSSFSKDDGLTVDSVQSIARAKDGELYFASKNGAQVFFPEGETWIQAFTGAGATHAAYVDQNGWLWLAHDKVVHRYDVDTRKSKQKLDIPGVVAIAESVDGALWFGTRSGTVHRHAPKKRTTTLVAGGRAGKPLAEIREIESRRNQTMWFATAKGLSRYLFTAKSWRRSSVEDGLPHTDIRAVDADIHGAVWIGTAGGVGRYQLNKESWTTFGRSEGLVSDDVTAVRADAKGAVWVGYAGGRVTRIIADLDDRRYEVGSIVTVPADEARLAASSNQLVALRNGRVCFNDTAGSETACTAIPDVTSLTATRSGQIWAGTQLSGLWLLSPDRDEQQLTTRSRLPSMNVTAVSTVPGSGGQKLWVGTGGGVARVKAPNRNSGQPTVETVYILPKLPPGPVAAIAAKADGAAYVAYNRLDNKWFFGDQALAGQRAHTEIWEIPLAGAPRRLEVSSASRSAFERATVSALAYHPSNGLWIATSIGLFRVSSKYANIEKASLQPSRMRHVAIASGESVSVWIAVDGVDEVDAYIIGYNPQEDTTVTVSQEHGLPKGDIVTSMVITDDGDLFALVADELVSGRIATSATGPKWWWFAIGGAVLFVIIIGFYLRSIRHHSDVVKLRADPNGLTLMPTLAELGVAVRRLRRAYVVDEVLEKLELPALRAPLIETLAHQRPCGAGELRALAMLLGMGSEETLDVRDLGPGITMLAAPIAQPEPLADKLVPIFALDEDALQGWSPGNARKLMSEAIAGLGYADEYPYLILCRESPIHNERQLLPRTHPRLVIADDELETLLLAPKPSIALAGYLVTRGVFEELSPYTTAGEVKSVNMFFGRSALIEKLGSMQSRGHLIVGPRRIGKSSLLKLLEGRFRARSNVEVVYLDFYGLKRHDRASRKLSRKLKIDLPPNATSRTLFADLLSRRYDDGSDKRGLVLIDEFDWLAKSDATLGYPLLAAMRTLQAEGVCSFILTGFDYLHREVLSQESPLYNFAHLTVLGPLDREDAYELATKPMQRLGVRYASPHLASRVVELTGGYPSQVQQFCATLLDSFKGRRLEISEQDVEAARRSGKVRDFLVDSFYYNATTIERIAMLGLLNTEQFTEAMFEDSLEKSIQRRIPSTVMQETLRHLRIAGFIVKQETGFRWSIPLLREALTTGDDPARRISRLIEELPDNQWPES